MTVLIVIYESAYPHTIQLGRLPGTTVYRNIKQYPETERYDGIVMVRIDAPIYFANVQNVRDKIRKYRLAAAADLAERNGDVKYIILEMAPVSHIDTSALHILGKFYYGAFLFDLWLDYQVDLTKQRCRALHSCRGHVRCIPLQRTANML
jgi:sulfate transporter 4